MGLKVTRIYSDALQAIVLSPEVGEACLGVAEKAKTIAIGLSADFSKTGHYASSFETRMEVRNLPKGHAHNVMSGVLVNTATYSLDVEYGYEGRSKRTTSSAHRVLTRTAAALNGA